MVHEDAQLLRIGVPTAEPGEQTDRLGIDACLQCIEDPLALTPGLDRHGNQHRGNRCLYGDDELGQAVDLQPEVGIGEQDDAREEQRRQRDKRADGDNGGARRPGAGGEHRAAEDGARHREVGNGKPEPRHRADAHDRTDPDQHGEEREDRTQRQLPRCECRDEKPAH